MFILSPLRSVTRKFDKHWIGTVNSVLSRNMSAQWNVYVSHKVPPKGVQILREHCNVTEWTNDDAIPRTELLKNVKGIDALFCVFSNKIDKELLDAAGTNLKVIGTMSVGLDHMDLAECKKLGILVGYTPDILTDATAELMVALLLATSRRIGEGISAVKSGEWGAWKPLWMCGQGLLHSTVGIVGLGRIGLGVGQRLRPFGVSRILYCGQSGPKPESAAKISAEYVSFEELLAQSDFVLITCALNSKTEKLFNARAFSKMKSNAILCNVSRGPIVDQEALYEALVTGRIRAAGLDVTVPEPLPPDHKLLKLKNCVVIPHIGSATEETRHGMSMLTAQNILAGLRGDQMPAQVKL